jgi:hypothetical protein
MFHKPSSKNALTPAMAVLLGHAMAAMGSIFGGGVTGRLLDRESIAKLHRRQKAAAKEAERIAALQPEIDRWNARVDLVKTQRLIRRVDKRRSAGPDAHAEKPAAPGPKFAKLRKHKQRRHPLQDAHGAYTLIGKDVPLGPSRRKWLGGISAQRGY